MLRCDKQIWAYWIHFKDIRKLYFFFYFPSYKLFKSLSNSYPDYLVIFIREHNKMVWINYSGFYHVIVTYEDQQIHKLLHKIISKLHLRNKRLYSIIRTYNSNYIWATWLDDLHVSSKVNPLMPGGNKRATHS